MSEAALDGLPRTESLDAIEAVGDDPVTEDIVIGQTADLEQFQWFVRAHLQGVTGELGWRVTLNCEASVPPMTTLLGLPVRFRSAVPTFSTVKLTSL